MGGKRRGDLRLFLHSDADEPQFVVSGLAELPGYF